MRVQTIIILFCLFTAVKAQNSTDICVIKNADINGPELCKDNLNIPRKRMPQITKQARANLQKYISHTLQFLDPDKVKPSQNQIKLEVVVDMMLEVLSGEDKLLHMAIDVSADGYILDGHHRWAMIKTLKRKTHTNEKSNCKKDTDEKSNCKTTVDKLNIKTHTDIQQMFILANVWHIEFKKMYDTCLFTPGVILQDFDDAVICRITQDMCLI